jgi:phage tail sheath gpL-like
MILNAMDIADTTTLDKFKVWGDGRWGELVRKPAIVFTGNTATTVTAATAVSSARTTDRVNSQLVAPGSADLPLIVAARQLARIARVANQNPPKMYTGQVADGLTPGADGDQWDFLQRDAAIKAGSSTIEVVDREIQISNVVTFYAPTGEPIPAYRFVVDIVKLQNVIFNLDLIFASDDWAGAPLIPDDQPTVNRDAKKPSMAVAEVAAVLDGLGLQAIISDPTTAKANTTAGIDSGNPKRLNVETTLQLAGNTNIINVTLNFGFFFGTATLAA